MNKKSNVVFGKRTKAITVAIAGIVCAGMLGTTLAGNFASAATQIGGGKFQSDYTSLEEAQKAAAKLGEDIGEEGSVLLKNKDNNALPLTGKEWVSVLGVKSDSVEGGNTTVADSLKDAGFKVNPELVNYYAGVGATIGQENVDKFTKSALSSMNIYNDVAVVIFSRTGGESNDCATVTSEEEDNKYGSKDMGWRHNALSTNPPAQSSGGSGGPGGPGGPGGMPMALAATETKKEYKHYLQLTDSEEELLELAKEKCEKVVVVINSSNVMELGNIQNDDEIDGIVWVGRPGADGLRALGKILNGSVNPSGKTVDIYPADLTADPTWYGYGKGEQYSVEETASHSLANGEYPQTYFRQADDSTLGSHIYKRQNQYMQSQIPGVSTGYSFTMYSEDIYMGYRYYETADAEAKADNYEGFNYDNAVVYPFGYGLSYTEFEWENKTPASAIENWSSKKTIELKVKVTNKGSVAGKDVVQVYAHAPYITGEVAKSEVVLVGFAKTSMLAPGKSETVTISVNVQDIASFDDRDKNGNDHSTYELDAGEYELRFQTDSHNSKLTQTLATLESDVILGTDDYSGNAAEALFSGKDEYNMLGWDPKTSETLVDEGKMTLLSRDNFAETFPAPKTAAQLVRSDEWFAFHEAFDQYNAEYGNKLGDNALYKEDETATTDAAKAQNAIWTIYASEFATGGKYAGWTQAASHTEGYTDVNIKLNDMTGILHDGTVYQNTNKNAANYTSVAAFNGKTGEQCWEIFMNQLTWDELVKLASNAGWGTPAMESIGKNATSDNDSPNNLSSTYNWGDECHIASTWNTDIAYREGVIMGNMAMQKGTTWYGPAMNTHRSPFGGRCNEYYSQDGYQGGMIGAAVIQGAQSKGVICYVKHCAMNDQEIYRMNLMTLASEQSAREIYFKQFQIAMQEGNCMALMTTYGSIGEISGASNYNFMTKLIRDEWGFEGYAVTDAWMPCKDYWPLDMLVRAGYAIPLENAGARGDNYESYLLSGTWNATKNCVELNTEFETVEREIAGVGPSAGITTKQTIKIPKEGGAKKTSYTQWYYVRKTAESELYVQANMNVQKNGYDLSSFKGKALDDAKQGTAYNASVAVNLSGTDSLSYAVTKGALPEGMTLNASTGAISGTSTQVGDYAFTVTLRADNWITAAADYTLSVKSAFTLDGSTSLKVGEEADIYIESETIKAADFDSVTYTLVSGNLPKGVVINGDHIEGIVKEDGTFNATIRVTTSKTTVSQGFFGPGQPVTTVKDYDFNVTLTVAEGDAAEVLTEAQIKALIETELAKADGLNETEVKALIAAELAKANTGLTEEQVKAIVDEAIKNNSDGGCSSAIDATTVSIAVAGLMLVCGAAVIIRRKKENKK